MRFAAGMLVGTVVEALLATAGGAGAVSLHWYTAGDILTKSELAQYGYVAGVYDGITYARDGADVAASHENDTNGAAHRVLKVLDEDLACLNSHGAAGGTLGQLRDWAVLQWTSPSNEDVSAVYAMLLTGCPVTPSQ